MSTIEKAAAKLAARGKAALKPATMSAPPAVERAGLAEPAPMSGAASTAGSSPAAPRVATTTGNYSAPQRWCEIDLERLAAKGFMSPQSGRSQLAHEMRRIKRPLLLNIKKANAGAQPGAPPANLIMVTSALPHEGKTFIAINLAMSVAAELDRRVLLVDADVAKNDISNQLELEPSRGLSDLLGETSYFAEDAVLTSNIERLAILPAGAPNDHMDELFASDMMADIARSLATADPQRVVIFDASPLLATTEAAVLARQMGQVVVVVEANKTPQDAVHQALSQIEGCAAEVSLVLNKTNRSGAAGYGYGYGYGYEYGRDEKPDEPGRAPVTAVESPRGGERRDEPLES